MKRFLDELTGYRVKVERDGREIVNLPGILALPGLLAAPRASIIGMMAAPLLGCKIHVESEDGRDIDLGKTMKEAADTVVDTAATAARTVREEIEKAWDEMSADDPEGCPEGQENEEDPVDQDTAEDPADQDTAEKEIPIIRVNPDDSEKV